MATDLTDFLWNKFPQYYAENDTLKDSEGKGTFQRFFEVIGVEVTEQAIQPLEDFINEIDPNTADDKFLTQIAWAVGNPPDILNDIAIYRTILSQIIKIYQIKGTKESYKLLFSLLGLTVELTEFFPRDNLYDSDLIYDDETDDATTYDYSGCEIACTEYSLIYDNLPGKTIAPLSPENELLLRQLIGDLIQPYTAVLRDLTLSEESLVFRGFHLTNLSIEPIYLVFFNNSNQLTSYQTLNMGDIISNRLELGTKFKMKIFVPNTGFDYSYEVQDFEGTNLAGPNSVSGSVIEGVLPEELGPLKQLSINGDEYEITYNTYPAFIFTLGEVAPYFIIGGPLYNLRYIDKTTVVTGLTEIKDNIRLRVTNMETDELQDSNITLSQPVARDSISTFQVSRNHNYNLKFQSQLIIPIGATIINNSDFTMTAAVQGDATDVTVLMPGDTKLIPSTQINTEQYWGFGIHDEVPDISIFTRLRYSRNGGPYLHTYIEIRVADPPFPTSDLSYVFFGGTSDSPGGVDADGSIEADYLHTGDVITFISSVDDTEPGEALHEEFTEDQKTEFQLRRLWISTEMDEANNPTGFEDITDQTEYLEEGGNCFITLDTSLYLPDLNYQLEFRDPA